MSGVSVLHGEARLHALDFWMRNPDYFADELLDWFENTGEVRHLDAARMIFATDEPDLRRFPMIRYRFGAYERLDDSLGILVCRDLIQVVEKKVGGRVTETEFRVLPSAFNFADRILVEFPILAWYADRAQLVAELAGDRGGAALKERQYEKLTYAETQMGSLIPAITQQVRARLKLVLANLETIPKLL